MGRLYVSLSPSCLPERRKPESRFPLDVEQTRSSHAFLLQICFENRNTCLVIHQIRKYQALSSLSPVVADKKTPWMFLLRRNHHFLATFPPSTLHSQTNLFLTGRGERWILKSPPHPLLMIRGRADPTDEAAEYVVRRKSNAIRKRHAPAA